MEEYTNPSGNYYDKYGTKNPVARYLMNGFLESFDHMVVKSSARSIYEIGCGEGHLSIRMKKTGAIVHGSDISKEIIAEARINNQLAGTDINFEVRSIYDLSNNNVGTPDLIVCCEVLEHLEYPEKALDKIRSLNSRYVLVSVLREPIWRFLNVARGKYLKDFGNTPGHLQHWSKKSFVRLLDSYFTISEVLSPLPWTMVLCEN